VQESATSTFPYPIHMLDAAGTVFTAQRAAAILTLKWTRPQVGVLSAVLGWCDRSCAERGPTGQAVVRWAANALMWGFK